MTVLDRTRRLLGHLITSATSWGGFRRWFLTRLNVLPSSRPARSSPTLNESNSSARLLDLANRLEKSQLELETWLQSERTSALSDPRRPLSAPALTDTTLSSLRPEEESVLPGSSGVLFGPSLELQLRYSGRSSR